MLGHHNLDDYGVGKTHNGRYLNESTVHYDGIHYFGPRGSWDYTNSLSNAIMKAISNNQDQRNPSPVNVQPKPVILTGNRYSVLTEGNY